MIGIQLVDKSTDLRYVKWFIYITFKFVSTGDPKRRLVFRTADKSGPFREGSLIGHRCQYCRSLKLKKDFEGFEKIENFLEQ